MRRIALALLLALGLAPAGRALAGGYSFEVPKATVTVTIEKSGSALIHYAITFRCRSGARPIDIVDIGMPTKKFEAISAAIDGKKIPKSAIKISTWPALKGNGYEIPLGGRAIQPGKEGVFEFTGRSYNMVYEDSTDPERQASFRFTPTWFDAGSLVGNTQLTLVYVLPVPAEDLPGVAERIVWHKKSDAGWKKGLSADGKFAAVVWIRSVRLAHKNEFSVSFPKEYVDKVIKRTVWDEFYDWWTGSVRAQLISAIIVLIAFGIIFFTATRGTGWSVFMVLTIALCVGMYKSPGLHLALYPMLLALGVLGYVFRKRRKGHYFPAELCREGGGIKRGLTAVEAAVLLEVPLHKILTMAIFALAKKGVLTIKSKQPLMLEVNGKEKCPGMWLLPGDAPVKLWAYESGFISAFETQHSKSVDNMKLSKPFDQLVKQVVGAMGGFDLVKTRDYYKSIVSRAWKQLKAESDYQARFKKADKALDWLMLDDDWSGGMRGLGGGGYHYYPWWWYGRPYGTYSYGGGRAFDGGGAGPAPEFSGPQSSFGDVVNSMTGRMETMSNDLAGSLDSLSTTANGGLDLSGFDKFTSETLESMAQGSGGGGGGGGCACAGCACACACAGGGR